MAPIAQTPPANDSIGDYDGSRPRFESLQAWLKIYGDAEYAVYKKDHAPSDLEYEEWATSVHAHGMYLWHATLDVWEEESSSDEGSDLAATKLVLRGPPEQKPKKPLTNGHGMRRAAKAPKSTSHEKSDEPGASGKRRRKPKKKYLSQEIVASGDSDDIEESTSAVRVAAPAVPSPPAPIATINGRRKSGGRRKKQFLSEETILPEDEDTDAMSIDAVTVSAADATNAFDALVLEHRTPVPETIAEPPKTKLGKKPRKKYLSQEIVSLDDDEDSAPADVTRSSTATASPEGPSTSSNSRRGLRARTATQQRPYSQDARVFEEQLLVDQDIGCGIKRSPKPKTTKLAQVSYAYEEPVYMDLETENEDNMLSDYEVETIAVQPEELSYNGRKAHYKGKGRAWKKTSEDEDQDYVSPVKIKGSNQPKRKLGKRKSTQVSEDLVHENNDLNEAEEPEVKEVAMEVKKEPVTHSPTPKGEKPKRRPRKSHHLSEEFVRDDSDTEAEEQQEQTPILLSPVQKTPKPKGRPRKSNQSISSKNTVVAVDGDDDFDAFTPTHKKSTPKSQPRKARGVTTSVNSTPECHLVDENVKIEQGVSILSPLQKPRKRKSGGSDES